MGEAEPTPAARADMRILVVEDHKDTATVLRRILESTGCAVNQCGTIAEAKKLAAEQEFDLVFCDIGLPDGSGLDLMRRLGSRQGLPGIALSGYGMDEDRAASRAAGFAEHFIKPVDPERLRIAVARLVGAPPDGDLSARQTLAPP